MGIIDLLQGPLNTALGTTASPSAKLTDSQRAYALAFFSAISQGVARHTKNPALNPPVPPLPRHPAASPSGPRSGAGRYSAPQIAVPILAHGAFTVGFFFAFA